jgi:CBS domain-containing protein
MKSEQLIASEIPTLRYEDTGNKALLLMEEYGYSQLPLVQDDIYIALVQESELLDWDHATSQLSEFDRLGFAPSIIVGSHPYEALRVAHDMNLAIVPVIDRDRKYLGAVNKDGMLKYITENSGITTAGGIVVLQVAPRDYTLYEIARICENEDVTITSTQVHPNELGMLEVTLKVNRASVDAVVSSFERHNYTVLEAYGEDNRNDDIEVKYKLLMNYINM